ncbi:transmembrane emp24 domain-containing protein 5-like [Haliotis rubra]|uniref:transmembrane emp24 domain-containing protein 5-like n=1 Tax=Haliotis rubra TaxID=36100 RepID=UPI001EE5F7FF|nr:transmembrane emp24 domain-containing protein 5-like [Haliotis rubra]
MAARYCVHFLSTLVITNRLFLVSTETVLGEKVDDEFDFDGLPGVQHEFKFEIAAGREECFFQMAAKGAKLHVSYEVLRGGDRNIDFFLKDPYLNVVDEYYMRTDGAVEKDIIEPGIYQVCFDNTQSRFSSKLVFFYLVTFVMEQWSKYVMEVTEIQGIATNFSASLSDVELSLNEVKKHQMTSRLNVIRDWYLIMGNNRYVGYWSVAQCVVVVVAAACQVYFLRRLFKVSVVTPSSKPRA